MGWFVIVIFITLTGIASYLASKGKQSKQLAYIKNYRFHNSIKNKILAKYPDLSDEQIHLVFRGLRDYFHLCNLAKRKMVAMPSQIVDEAWHEFILFTRAYGNFSQKALGRFLHHTPTEAMSTPTVAQEGIRRAWRLACHIEKINPKMPNRLPLLFGIDAMLQIDNGFTYSLDCHDKSSPNHGDGYCAGHIGCSSGCAGDSGASSGSDGFFDGLFDSSSCGANCGGGCGGD